jgi:Ca-activated chloride channel family protein
MLVDLANAANGKYYQLTALSDISELSNDLQSQQSKKEHIQVKTYKELFAVPLLIALVLYFLSITKIAQRFFIFLPLLLFIPNRSDAGVFDFYHLYSAQKAYKEKKYPQAAAAFEALTPSQQSYYNTACAYYKAGRYKSAVKIFTQIRSAQPTLKQRIFYNLGNCAVKLKKYDMAKRYYIDALALGQDSDALYNLHLLNKLHLKTVKDVSKMLPQNQNAAKKKKSRKSSQKKSKKSADANKKSSNRGAGSQANGSGSSKKSKQKSTFTKVTKKRKGVYKFTYKAYEKINKGYTDEKEPW